MIHLVEFNLSRDFAPQCQDYVPYVQESCYFKEGEANRQPVHTSATAVCAQLLCLTSQTDLFFLLMQAAGCSYHHPLCCLNLQMG